MSIGNEPTATRRGSPVAWAGARRGVPSWAPRRAETDAPATAAVSAALQGLAAEGWTTLHGLHLAGAAAADVDPVVVVGPGGIVVVDVLPAPGPDGAARAAAVVTALLAPRHRTAVRALVCLVADEPADVGPTPAASDTTVVGLDALVARLRALPPRLHPADVDGLATHLDLHLGGPTPDVLTTAALETDVRVARRRVVRPLTSGRPVTSGHPPTSGRPRASRPGARPWAVDPVAPAHDEPTGAHVVRRGVVALTLRAGVVVSTAWLAWVFTTAPLGLG